MGKKNECNHLKQLRIRFIVKNDLPREEEYMYQKPSIMNTSHSPAALRYGNRAAIISEKLTALALSFLFHIPVWFALTALQALQ